ncbi:MAG: division/cell wall cluster transcriptional repressor MraZ [Patescibacteria group bacterium]
MLIGEYKHTIDAKKRISLPAKFRRELGKKAVVTRGLDKCLFVYSVDEWKKVAETLSGLSTGQADSRNFSRLLLAGAVDVEIDSLGRILIPDYLKNYAELKDKAIVAGVYKRIEIWDEKRWEEFKAGVEEKADLLAEKLGELGVY